jgi:Skp family chaperone for outer membrane proteins
MKSTLAGALLALPFVTAAASAQQSSLKIGFVNLATVTRAAPNLPAAESTFNKEVAAFQKTRLAWSDSLQRLVAVYTKEEPSYSFSKKQSEQARLQKIEQDFVDRQNRAEQALLERQKTIFAPIQALVQDALDEVRAEGGYAMIFQRDENSIILAVDKNLDLTGQVVRRLQTKRR